MSHVPAASNHSAAMSAGRSEGASGAACSSAVIRFCQLAWRRLFSFSAAESLSDFSSSLSSVLRRWAALLGRFRPARPALVSSSRARALLASLLTASRATCSRVSPSATTASIDALRASRCSPRRLNTASAWARNSAHRRWSGPRGVIPTAFQSC